MTALLATSSTHSLVLHQCATELERQLVVLRHWSSLEIDASAEMAERFEQHMVNADALTLVCVAPDTRITPQWRDDQDAHFGRIVSHSPSLRALKFTGARVDILVFAKALRNNPSVQAYQGDLGTHHDQAPAFSDTWKTLAILQGNTSLRSWRDLDFDELCDADGKPRTPGGGGAGKNA